MSKAIIEQIIKELEKMDDVRLNYVLEQIRYIDRSPWPNFGYPIDLPYLEVGLKPRKLTWEQFNEYRPEKWEFIDGIMFGDLNDLRKLAKLVEYNLGLEEIVKNAPKCLWLEALETIEDKEE